MLYIKCVWVCVYRPVHACEYLWRPEGALYALELKSQAVVSHLMWIIKLNLGPLQKQHMFLTAKSSLQT